MKLSTALPLALGLTTTTHACLLPHEREAGYVRRSVAVPNAAADNGFPIGKGDRFNDGATVPQGLGTQDRNLGSILNINEVASGLKGLANTFSNVKLFDAPYKTYEGRLTHGAIIGGEPRAFIQSGIHARERGGPDHVLYFISDLLAAARDGKGVKYGNQSYTNAQVKTALSPGIVLIPLTNPDGVNYDQQSNTCWRKNRNPKSASGSSGVGIDLNRNFDFMWDYKKYFNQNSDGSGAASDDPDSEVFHGTSPASEPEVQNMQWVMQQYTNISWFLDLHSYGGDVLFSWGDDNTQTTDKNQNFANPAYDNKRGYVGRDPTNSQYKEYMDADDYTAQINLSNRMVKSMRNSGSIRYTAEEASALYPTAGASTDYGLGLYYGHKCGANRIQGLTLEFGDDSGLSCPFYPTNTQYHESMRQVASGLMEFLLTTASTDGAPKFWKC
ncbi:Carboxypeptidase O-like protein [Cladobotryum mycophilum]|uniref:Carboxypeptidase O-like protein n=1 Tax=Cladobotryum mycophilum TaxID=491253 RepID=A0ABR0SLP3_9HYPO